MKKLLSIALVVVLLAGIAVSGTMAYLQDTDSDVNVMTLGNVDIEQHEYERVVENGEYKKGTVDEKESYILQPFTQGKPLLPIVGDPSSPDGYQYAGWDDTTVRMSQVDSYGGMDVFAGKNAQDKFVTVENTGRTNAYVRTIVAIEIGEVDAEKLGTSHHNTWTKNEVGTIVVDGNTYFVYEYVYNGANGTRHDNGILPAGDTTYPNLSQVYLGSDATNEDMEKIDGNKNGTLEILVLSQAVQADGFEATTDKSAAQVALDTAFGVANEANVQAWFGGEEFKAPTAVATAEELTAALEAGGLVMLTDDIDLTESVTIPAGVTVNLDLNGKKITGIVGRDAEGNRIHTLVNNGTLTIKNGTVASAGDNGGSAIYNAAGAVLTIEDTTIEGAKFAGTAWPSYGINNYGTMTVNSATIKTYHGGIATGGDGVTVINYATVDVGQNTQTKQTSWALYTCENGKLTVNDGVFENTKNEYNQVYGGGYLCPTSTGEVVINGGTFNKTEADNNGSGIYYQPTNLVITGGTFDTNPSAYVADGYAATDNGDGTWTVTAQ